MGEYAAFLLILVFGFACGYGTARARGDREDGKELVDAVKADMEIERLRNERDVTFNELHASKQCGDVFYMGADGGYYYNDGSPYPDPETHEKVKAMTRRRDDNRAQRAPEEPWQ